LLFIGNFDEKSGAVPGVPGGTDIHANEIRFVIPAAHGSIHKYHANSLFPGAGQSNGYHARPFCSSFVCL